MALVGAVLLLLDFSATSVVSAATAMDYLAGEVSLPFSTFVGFALVFVVFTAMSLGGVKESARIALAVLTFHVSGLHVDKISFLKFMAAPYYACPSYHFDSTLV
jgi:hypothetical protein